MADGNTFKDLWTRILLYAPELPVPLAQEFINTAYQRAIAYTPWSQLHVEAEIVIPDTVSDGSVDVVQGSDTVTGNGTAWDGSEQYRQFMVINSSTGGVAPYYTIMDVDTLNQTLTLDRPYEKADGVAEEYNITLVYIMMPSDFLSFDGFRDLTNNWKLFPNYTQSQLDAWDAIRSTSGTPWVLASAPPLSEDSTSEPIKRYEMWPRCAPDTRVYAYRYWKKPPVMTEPTDRLAAPVRADVIRKGALAELAIWPGTSVWKNPYFNLDTHDHLEKEFQLGLQECWKNDQEISQTTVKYADWDDLIWAPIDARFLQTHAVF